MLKAGERLDDLHRDGLKIIQNPDAFCFGIDAVLLSHFAGRQIKPGQRHLDLCCGNGIVPILLTAKSEGASFYGVEIQGDAAEMAARSVALNNLEDKIRIFNGDIKDTGLFSPCSFNVVTVNPPYMPIGGGAHSPNDAIAIARHEVAATLEDVVATASRLLMPHGRFCMVHRPHRLAEIFANFQKYGLAAKILQFVQPVRHKPPNLMLVSATKGGASDLIVEAPLIVYDDDGNYTSEVYKIHYE